MDVGVIVKRSWQLRVVSLSLLLKPILINIDHCTKGSYIKAFYKTSFYFTVYASLVQYHKVPQEYNFIKDLWKRKIIFIH